MDQTTARRAAAPTFALVMFLSAALIFLLQPMFARMTTPLLGGSPAVWNTSMVFFQAALLVGYAYAHALARRASLRNQVLVHALVLLSGVVVLPIAVSDLLGPPNPSAPSLWLFAVLALSVGLPYAAASATAPLLQAWFARTGRADAADPYYLYAASNLGSLLGLGAYPTLMEPLLGLSTQANAWSIAYVVVGVLIIISGFVAVMSKGEALAPAAHEDTPQFSDAPIAASGAVQSDISWRNRFYWMAAAAAPSSLLLGVTSHISTDIASAPFLWVVPLALYLLTFVVAFGKQADAWREPVSVIAPLALVALVIAYSQHDFVMTLGANLICFFFAALICHLTLSAHRPSAEKLTEFYMYVSLGGVLGGAATALLAPMIFNDVYEYPLALAAIALFFPTLEKHLPRFGIAMVAAFVLIALILRFDHLFAPIIDRFAFSQFGAGAWREPFMTILAVSAAWGLALGARWLPRAALLLAITACSLMAVVAIMFLSRQTIGDVRIEIGLGVAAAALFANRFNPWVAALMVLVAFAIVKLDSLDGDERNVVFQDRSFFGVTRVYDQPNAFGTVRVMLHGTTIHGAQYVSGERTRTPMTYYNAGTGLGEATVAAINSFEKANVGLVGLGAGSTACNTRPQDTLTIFEIDPMVVEFSTKPGGVFTYVPQCKPDAAVVLGDARLGIKTKADGALDVLLVDAFSSDAVPAHLMTTEAISLYFEKLSPNGIVILHLSNRNLDLVSEAARVAQALGLAAVRNTASPDVSDDYWSVFDTSAMILARSPEALARLKLEQHWTAPDITTGRAWSDEYINMVRPVLANF